MGSNLYVKLDASYDDDPKILMAGEKAEVLYLRGLCLAKRILSDGFIADVHLPRFGLSSVQARAKKLVEVGLWDRVDGGYLIRAWLKHNSSKDEVEAIKEGGARGNHVRWHVREGKPSGDCPHCVADGLARPSGGESPAESGGESGGRIPEAEAEAEAEATTPSAAADPVGDQFDQFWQTYPRGKAGKPGGDGPRKPALLKWRRLTDDQRTACLDAVGNYAAHIAQPDAPNAAHAITWLNQERWEQWETPAEAGDGRRGGVSFVD